MFDWFTYQILHLTFVGHFDCLELNKILTEDNNESLETKHCDKNVSKYQGYISEV